MFNQTKTNGAFSTAGNSVKKGSKGRLELSAQAGELSEGGKPTTFDVKFTDIGNYGRERWFAQFSNLTRADVEDAINLLQELLAGEISTTYTNEVLAEGEVEVEPVAEVVEVFTEVVDPVEVVA